MHKVSIKNKTLDSYFPTQILIDGQPLKAVSAKFQQSVDTVPICEIEIHALPDIESLARIQFQFMPQTIQDASKVLRHSLTTDKELYNAFLSSISSALKEIPEGTGIYDIAEVIADRIIGAN